jgi:hypothetical protein
VGAAVDRSAAAAGDSFRADWRIADLIRHADTCTAPEPGIVCRTTARPALQQQVWTALTYEPRKEPDLARRSRRLPCDGCTAHA